MDAPPPLLGVAAEPSSVRPEAASLTVGATPPVIASAAPPWPRSAQWATVGLLVLALGLLGWHAAAAFRWSARPTEPASPNADRIDLNRADRAQLLQLPGVGDVTAERIEEYRRSHNGFKSVDELRQVHGVGPALMERLRPLVEVQPPEALADDGEAAAPVAHAAPEIHKAAAPKADKPAAAKTKGDGPAEPINVNTASADELRQLPGIGATLSARIIQAREQRPFQSVEELRRVKGVGVKTLNELRPFVKVD
jgi:competence protein ComEA